MDATVIRAKITCYLINITKPLWSHILKLSNENGTKNYVIIQLQMTTLHRLGKNIPRFAYKYWSLDPPDGPRQSRYHLPEYRIDISNHSQHFKRVHSHDNTTIVFFFIMTNFLSNAAKRHAQKMLLICA